MDVRLLREPMPLATGAGRASAARRDVFCLGWGLLTAWGLVGMGAGGRPAAAESPEVAVAASLVNMAGMLAAALAALARLRVGRAGGGAAGGGAERGLAASGAAFAIVGCAGVLAASAASAPVWLLAAAQGLASLGYVLLSCGWLEAYRGLEAGAAERLSVLSTAACAVVCLAAFLVPQSVATALWLCLPAASACLLGLAASKAGPNGALFGRRAPAASPGCGAGMTAAAMAPHLLCALGVAVASLALVAPTSSGLAGGALSDERGAQLSGLALSAALVLYCTVYARRISLPQFFKVLYPLGVLGLWLYSGCAGEAPRFAGLCLLSAAQWVLYLFVWLYALESAGRAGLASYGLLRAAFEAGFLASGCLACLGPGLLPVGGLAGACFGAAALLIMTIILPLEGGAEASRPAGGAPVEGPGGSAAQPDAASVARLLGLSERESEVLAYLRRGYSFVAIRNELYISKSTVDTYVRRIYRKCQVHSRQELVELCERVERGEAAPGGGPGSAGEGGRE